MIHGHIVFENGDLVKYSSNKWHWLHVPTNLLLAISKDIDEYESTNLIWTLFILNSEACCSDIQIIYIGLSFNLFDHFLTFSESSGVVVHKDSKWFTAWQDFKENNQYVQSECYVTLEETMTISFEDGIEKWL